MVDDMELVGRTVNDITSMGVVVAIEQSEGFWFVSVFNTDYELTGIAEQSSSLLTALERVEHRLLTEK